MGDETGSGALVLGCREEDEPERGWKFKESKRSGLRCHAALFGALRILRQQCG